METLRAVFPAVPDAALRRVLEMCDGSVEAASEWILEHDWRELERDGSTEQEQRRGGADAAEGGDAEEDEGASRPQTVVVSAGNMAGELPARERRRDAHGPQRYFARSSMLGARFEDSGGENGGDSEDDEDDGDDEDEDDDDEDEDDDDDDDDDDDPNEFYDSGDDAYMRGMLPPLTKRVKIAQADTDGKTSQPNADAFWVAFDDVVVTKNLIELLNTTLSKLAHSRVVLLNRPARNLDEGTASARLSSVLSKKDPVPAESREATEPARANPTNGRIALSVLLNSSSPPAAISPVESKVSTLSSTSGVGQKRKRVEEDSTPKKRGFFAHFFPVSDLDMIWRSVMHAHLFNSRFGETIEFHTASSGLFHKRDFDELMHLHSHSATTRTASLNLSPFTSLKCCLILPCEADDEEIFRVGKHLHSILKLHGSLYYRTLNDNESTPATNNANERHNTLSDLLDEDGKMTEDSFRRFARYRIKRDEPAAKDTNADDGKHPADHFLAYQRQQKVEYCLQVLKTDGWDRQLSS